MASALVRQVSRVRRRLFLGSLLATVAWGWVAALAVAAGWFLVQPYLIGEPPAWLRWAVVGGLAVAGTLVAVIVSVLRAPSSVSAALSLDHRFALKERVTTSLTLAPDELASPAGQALLADVEQRLAGVRVGDRFPIALPWKPAAMLPLTGLAVLLVALFWNPQLGAGGTGDSEDELLNPAAKGDVEKQMKALAVKPRPKKPEEQPKSAEMKRIEDEIDKFTRRPRDTREEVRDRIKDATALEDEIRRQQKEQAARMEALKEQMKQVERLSRKDRDKDKNKEGPAKKAAGAVARGEMEQAAAEFEKISQQLDKEEEKERLRRKQHDPKASDQDKKKAQEELEKLEKESKLSRKDREDLKKQLDDLANQLERLTRNKEELAKELKDLLDKGEIDKEQLERELEQLDKNAEKLSPEEIKELVEALKQCKDCMGEGKDGEAAKKLQEAAKKCAGMCKGGNGQGLARKLAQIQQVRRALSRSLAGQGGPGGGPRPQGKDTGDTATEDKYAPGQWDKGKLEVVGEGPLGGFKGPRKPSEMSEEIRQAAQEAPAAIDRQRLPPSARKMARGYFEKVRGPDKDKKDAKKP
jgi:hypothetical protein